MQRNLSTIAFFLLTISQMASAQVRPGSAQADTKRPNLNGVYLVEGYKSNLIDMNPGFGEAPFQPEAAARYKALDRAKTDTGPSSRCLPPGIGFLMTMPYALELIQTESRVLTFHEFGNYVRQIWTDGRGHEDAYPTWLGHSVGKYEGDTLVVDTVGFNGKGWMDQMGLQASEELHTTERFRRNNNTLEYSLTIDDPKTFTQPWTVHAKFNLIPNGQIVEFVCTENNKFLNSPGMHMEIFR